MAEYTKPKPGSLAKREKPKQVITTPKDDTAEKIIRKQLDAKKPEGEQHDWSDAVPSAKSVSSGAGKALDKVTDVLIDKEAWGDIIHGRADKRDYLNAALDASMLIPGVGLAGGAARIGARQALKLGAREAEKLAAPKLTGLAARVAERKAAGGGARIAGRDAAAAVGKHRGEAGIGSRAGIVGERTGKESSVLGRLLNEGAQSGRGAAESVATRQTRALAGDKSARILAGKGTRVGFNQTKRRIATNALLAGGANLLGSGINAALNAGGSEPAVRDKNNDGILDLTGGGQTTGYYLMAADGSVSPVPDSAAKALAAAYQNAGGSPNGEQVVYLGR